MVIVSSGAIGVGCLRLGLKERPGAIAQKQALAAVGQVHLMRYYEDFFSAVGLVRTRIGRRLADQRSTARPRPTTGTQAWRMHGPSEVFR